MDQSRKTSAIGGRRQRALLLCLIALIFIANSISMTLAGTVAVAPNGYSYDATRVALRIGQYNFQVPREFLFPNVPKSITSVIGLQAILPKIEPISPDNADCFTHRNRCDRIVMIVVSGDPALPAQHVLNGIFNEGMAKTVDGPYGLAQYIDHSSETYQDLYGSRLSKDEFYWIFCTKLGNRFDTCTYDQPLDPNLSLRYVFRRSELAYWAKIHSGIMALIASIRSEEK